MRPIRDARRASLRLGKRKQLPMVRKARSLYPSQSKHLIASQQKKLRLFYDSFAKSFNKHVVPAIESDTLDAVKLEAAFQRVTQAAMSALSVIEKRVSLFSARIATAAQLDTEKLLGTLVDYDQTSIIALSDERIVERLRNTISAQVNALRKAVERAVPEKRVKDAEHSLWLSRVRTRFIVSEEMYVTYRAVAAQVALASGSDKGMYVTARDERVRDRHLELEGQFFSWTNPPSTMSEPNCRCMLIPVEALK